MRLIRLRVKNIASLKGEHEIDFQEIQRGSPLFAITGETGAGKSSLLNSIGLALYGQIYKKNVNQLDVVTLGEKEGSIELIFQVKGKNYLADWRAKVRKQNGELYSTPQTPARNLYTLEGTDFDASKLISKISSTELLNLDFDQFCKCIILNQGEFAKFLTSSFTERKDILEKLYPGELLESIGRELKLELDNLTASKNEVAIKLGELRGDNLSGDLLKEQKKSLELELTQLETASKNLEDLDYHFVSLFSYYEKFQENEKKKESIKRDMALETTKYNHLLKTGEALEEEYLNAKKAQETELPFLQAFLKKEETLKLLEEGWLGLKKRTLDLKNRINDTSSKLDKKISEENDHRSTFNKTKMLLTLPYEELKVARHHLDAIFDVFSEKELIEEELRGKTERLSQLEVAGKDLKKVCEELDLRLKLIPANIKELEKEAEKKKTELQGLQERKQRANIKFDDLSKKQGTGAEAIKNLRKKLDESKALIVGTQDDLLPIETTLKLQEVLNASQICVEHALKEQKQECPVCSSQVSSSIWMPLKEKLASTDLGSLRKKFDDLTKLLLTAQKEEEHCSVRLTEEMSDQDQREAELKALSAEKELSITSAGDLDLELDKLRKSAWEQETILKEKALKDTELSKARDLYIKAKGDVTQLEQVQLERSEKLKSQTTLLNGLVKEVSKDSIRDLKVERKNLSAVLESEISLEKAAQEKLFLEEQKSKLTHDYQTELKTEDEQLKKISELKTELEASLEGQKASDLISKITQNYKLATENWNRQTEAQKKQELILKDSQGRLYSLDELTKDFDLQFRKELHAVKSFAPNVPREELLKLSNLDVDFSTPRELFIPLKDLLSEEKEASKHRANECRMNFASVKTKLIEWEKLQDKIQLLELHEKEVNASLSRKMRLFEVLGKDELRTFVLSLVEANLIQQTNDELQKLCQGRYEIVHQTKSMKMTPEFFILDKFREGGRRKVSTLSGGETFMVSLAMALGLAEMTRGQAEIDSLFIDEGFGTLDHESLEDVLDMLKQIQTRGLMVGVISHIKTLTNALPVNLVLNKRQDGTSSVSIQLN
jgi:exonuclease SbcC